MAHPSIPLTAIATLDIAKHTHWFAAFAPDLTLIIPPHPITTDTTALQTVMATLTQLAHAGSVAIAMEPTSIYHLPWLHALTAALPPNTPTSRTGRDRLQAVIAGVGTPSGRPDVAKPLGAKTQYCHV